MSAQAFVAASAAQAVTARERALATARQSSPVIPARLPSPAVAQLHGLPPAQYIKIHVWMLRRSVEMPAKKPCRERMFTKTALANSEGPVRHIATNCHYWPNRRRKERPEGRWSARDDH
jgi:hypothetical protein